MIGYRLQPWSTLGRFSSIRSNGSCTARKRNHVSQVEIARCAELRVVVDGDEIVALPIARFVVDLVRPGVAELEEGLAETGIEKRLVRLSCRAS